jgi:hypothetical protein
MLGYQPQQRTIIIMTYSPVDELIVCQNIIKEQYKKVEFVEVLQFYLFDVLSLVEFLLTAPS